MLYEASGGVPVVMGAEAGGRCCLRTYLSIYMYI